MQAQMKPSIWFLTLLALLSAPHVASAYYDPGVQRWINRDPIGQSGFELARNSRLRITWSFLQPAERFEGPHLYVFTENAPISRVDALGLDWGPWDPGQIVPPDQMPGANCPADPCSGPPGGKAGPQDNICSVPGGGILGRIEGDTGITKCCHQHDDCYVANGCNSYSWLPGCGSKACKQCNSTVVRCIANELFARVPPTIAL